MGNLALPILKHVQSPNFSPRPAGSRVRLVVVHDCEGGYAGAIQTFLKKGGPNPVSAHLVLREDGLECTQMVDFAMKAWHACDFNPISIGLEMAGFWKKGFGAPEWQSAANIVAFLLHRYGLPNRWAQGGQGEGFCSHYNLGRAGGGHIDPTTDPAIWAHFCNLVTGAYALAPPASWTGAPGIPPPMPAGFVPTPTIRRD